MSNARSKNQPQPQFNGIPGMGTLLYIKALGNNAYAWQGPLTLANGEHMVLQGIAKIDEKGKGDYDVKVLNPVGWKQLGSFKFKPFGASRLAQDVETEVTGPMKVYPGVTRSGQKCVRLQCVTEAGRAQPPVM